MSQGLCSLLFLAQLPGGSSLALESLFEYICGRWFVFLLGISQLFSIGPLWDQFSVCQLEGFLLTPSLLSSAPSQSSETSP